MGPEKAFETKIRRMLEDEGAWVVKYFANAYTKKGIPDLLCCVNGYFLAIEVKSESGRPSPLQVREAELIRSSGGHALIVYPKDFDALRREIQRLKSLPPS